MSAPIQIITGGLGSDDAAAALAEWRPAIDRRIFYPYYWFLFRYSARTLIGRTALPVSCLVDARTRVGATADRFTIEPHRVPPNERLTPAIDAPRARAIAHRYSAYVMRHRRRALVAPRADEVLTELIYKPFWIVRCSPNGGPDCKVVVDGISGGFHVMNGGT